MQGGLVARKVSVRPSVKRVNCDKTKEKSVQIFIPYKISFSLVLWGEEWLVVKATPYTGNFVSPILNRYSLVTPSEKGSINTNRKSTTHFPVSLRWSAYVAPNPPQKNGG